MKHARICVWLLCVAAVGCGDDGTDPSVGSDEDAGDVAARCPDDLPEFFAEPTAGTESVGQNEIAKARVVAASSVPPIKGSNDWTVQIMDLQDAPLEGVTIAQACAFMPVHGHGLPAREIVDMGEPGLFDLKNLVLRMRGLWEVQIVLTVDSDAGDALEFTRCDSRQRYPGNELVVLQACVRDD